MKNSRKWKNSKNSLRIKNCDPKLITTENWELRNGPENNSLPLLRNPSKPLENVGRTWVTPYSTIFVAIYE